MSRGKQINLTVPVNKLEILERFDQWCETSGYSRSAAMMKLIESHIQEEDEWPTQAHGSSYRDELQEEYNRRLRKAVDKATIKDAKRSITMKAQDTLTKDIPLPDWLS